MEEIGPRMWKYNDDGLTASTKSSSFCSANSVHSHRTRIYCVFAPAASAIGLIQYIWSSCFVCLCFALYLSAAQGWDAKHLLSIFLSQQLYTIAAELQAVVPAVTLLMLKVCLKPSTLWLKLKYLYLWLSAASSTWNTLSVMWARCPLFVVNNNRKSLGVFLGVDDMMPWIDRKRQNVSWCPVSVSAQRAQQQKKKKKSAASGRED